jgi:hypothetical protein
MLNLHIFEERYKQMISECLKQESFFLIPPFINNRIMPLATLMECTELVKKYPDGKMDVRTKAVSIRSIDRVENQLEGKLYSGAYTSSFNWNTNTNKSLSQSILDKMELLFDFLNIHKELPALNEDFSTYLLGHLVGFRLEQEYEFLEIGDESKRQEYLLDHLNRILPMAEQVKRIQDRAKMNGHFRMLQSPK